MKECDTLRKVCSTVQPASALNNDNDIHGNQKAVHNGEGDSGLDNKDNVIVDDEVQITLSGAQSLIVDALKAALDGGQFLGYLQGFPGAGKQQQLRSWRTLLASVSFTAAPLVQHLHTSIPVR